MRNSPVKKQRGNTLLGFILGGVVGLLAALLVALYVNHVPIPFFQHDDVRTKKQDEAELAKNKNWNPNAYLFDVQKPVTQVSPPNVASVDVPPNGATLVIAGNPGTPVAQPAGVVSVVPAATSEVVAPPAHIIVMPAGEQGDLVPAGATSVVPKTTSDRKMPETPKKYSVQVGAYHSKEEADANRASLSLNGFNAKIFITTKNGTTYYRVRLGPFENKSEADHIKEKVDKLGSVTSVVPES
jgi:cell division protein FtsN